MLEAAAAASRLRFPVARALDVGSGTGLSAHALGALSRRVVGIDPIAAMLHAAGPEPGVRYACARGEQLPFASGSFDVATLGCVFHWCEPGALFAELARVLRPGAELVLYNNGFFGEMRELDAAKSWFDETYAARYPAPPRREAFHPDPSPPGFATEAPIFVDEWIEFDLEELVRYLTTQSNVIHAVESGTEGLDSVEAFLHAELGRLFQAAGAKRAGFRFGGLVYVLRRQEARDEAAS